MTREEELESLNRHNQRIIDVMDKQIERLQRDYMDAHSKYLGIMTELAKLTVKYNELTK